MKHTINYVFFIACIISGSLHDMVAADKESTKGFLPPIVQPSSKPLKVPSSSPRDLAFSADASVVLRITKPMPELDQKPGSARLSTQSSSGTVISPRYDRVLLSSPVLSAAGSSMVGASPRLDRAGIKLTSLSSSVVSAASPSGFEVGSKK